MNGRVVDGSVAASLRTWADQPSGPTAQEAAAVGATVQQLAFEPGERTRDRGDLGARTGLIELRLPDDVTAITTHPVTLRSTSAPVDRFETPAASGSTLRLAAVEGGRYTIEFQSADGSPRQVLASAPHIVRVADDDLDVTDLLSALGQPATVEEREALWHRVLGTAEEITAHLLRPLNVRLLWPARSDGTRTVLADPLPQWTDVDLPLRRSTQVDARRAATDVIHLRAARPEHQVAIEQAGGDVQWDPLPAADGVVVPVRLGLLAWGSDPSAGAGAVTAVLAAAAASDDATTWRTLAARELAVSVARAVCVLLDLPAQVQAARVALEPANLTIDRLADLCDPAPQDPLRDVLGLHRPVQNGVLKAPASVAADLVDGAGPEFGSDRWTDLVALHRTTHPALRPFREDSPRGLPYGPMTAFDVLVGLVDPLSLAAGEAVAPLPAPYGGHAFTYGDHDAVVIDDDGTTVDVGSVRYGGAVPAVPGPDEDLIALAHRDLWQSGLTSGIGLMPGVAAVHELRHDTLAGPVHAAGRYGYLAYTATGPDWSGAAGAQHATITRDDWARWRDLKRGHGGWAVRELQIAHHAAPNVVVERLDAAAPYADRLTVVGHHEPTAPAPSTPPLASEYVTGLLDPVTASALRRWRFMRRRNPVVVEAWSSGANDPRAATGPDGGGRPPSTTTTHPAGRTHLWHDNVVNADDVMSTNPRMYLTDRSGLFARDGPFRTLLGDWGVGTSGGTAQGFQQGPQTSLRHHVNAPGAEFAPIDGDELHDFSDAADDAAARDSDVHALIATIAAEECYGHYDVLNSYDRAVVSLPLFHHTLVGGSHAQRPAHVGGIIGFLRNPDGTLDGDAPRANDPDDEGTSALSALDDDARQSLVEAARRAFERGFGRFGVEAAPLMDTTYGAGYVLLTGLTQVPNGGPDMMPGGVSGPRGAAYQAYAQWFRSWPWFWRFIAAARTDVQYRRLLYLYDVVWARRQFAIDFGVVDLHSEVRYLAVATMWLRHRVWSPTNTAPPVRNAINAGRVVVGRTAAGQDIVRNLQTDDLTAAQVEYVWRNSLRAHRDILNKESFTDALSGLGNTAMPSMSAIRGFRDRLAQHIADEGE